MSAKEFLLRIRLLNKVINDEIAERERLLRVAKAPAVPKHSGGSSRQRKKGAPYESIIARAVELEQKISSDVDTLVDVEREVYDTVLRLDNELQKEVLVYKYIAGLSNAEIADKTGRTARRVYQIHSKALKKLQKVLDISLLTC